MSQTFAKLVEEKLTRLFAEIAKEVSEAEVAEEIAAGVPLELFAAEQYMVAQWREYVESGPAATRQK